MTHDHSALFAQLDALKSAEASAVFAELIRAGLQALIEAEAAATIGASRYERTEGSCGAPQRASTESGVDQRR
jgi:transposase-like protein